MSIFSENNISSGVTNTEDVLNLQKALSANYGTDSSTFTGGRALIEENVESEVINVLAQNENDYKIMNSIKTTPVKSTVHEVITRTEQGDYKHVVVGEGEISSSTEQELKRKIYNMKYLQTERGVTKQMELASTFEDAYASEKIAGVQTLMKGAEYLCFNGDSSVVPEQFDGFLSCINKASENEKNVTSLRGASLGSVGESVFDDISEKVMLKGGWLEKALYPPVLSKELKDIFASKGNYIMNMPLNGAVNPMFTGGLPPVSTAVGATISLSGRGCGADKFYQVKGKVIAEGDPIRRPVAPSSVTATATANATGSEFTGDFGDGDYTYTVHAVNKFGVSEGTSIASPVTVAKGSKVELVITAGTGVLATGFIICRSKKDGTEVMEMVSIANSGNTTTTYEDLNKELPGTASMLLLPRQDQNYYTFGQLLPASTTPLGKTVAAERFLVMLYGSLEVRAPQFCGLVKDIRYNGGLY